MEQSLNPFTPAGNFSSWLRQMRHSLQNGYDMEVACGDCIGCCSSSYFIHIKPSEKETLDKIPQSILFPAPGMPDGHLLMGYDDTGRCPMLEGNNCTIYRDRPKTCRNYDCRLFAAAGITAGGAEKVVINKKVDHWAFSYPSKRDSEEHSAVKAAAMFIYEHADLFPGGRVPDNPSQLAILAVKSYDVFIKNEHMRGSNPARSPKQLADAIVEACRQFDGQAKSLNS